MAHTPSSARPRSSVRISLFPWLLAVIAFAITAWLFWPFITAGVVDARPEVAAGVMTAGLAWFWLGLVLRKDASMPSTAGHLPVLPWLILIALSTSMLTGIVAFLAFGPVLATSRNQQVRWAALLEIAEYVLIGLLLFAAAVAEGRAQLVRSQGASDAVGDEQM